MHGNHIGLRRGGCDMSDGQDSSSKAAEPSLTGWSKYLPSLEKMEIFSGLLFILASIVIFGISTFKLIGSLDGAAFNSEISATSFVVQAYGGFIFLAGIGLLCVLVGMKLLARAGRLSNFVIRPEDKDHIWPLIEAEKVNSIDQYIRLASLSGLSGTFTKIGFTGLPLATVGLTLIFVVLSLATGNGELMELAKLTLGAFIGSFVQRQVERGERDPGNGEVAARPAAVRGRLPI